MQRQVSAVGATLTACALVLSAAHPVRASEATVQTSLANAALRYLYTQVQNDGSIEDTLGSTEDTVISDADNGYDPATLKSPATGTTAYAYLSANASTITTAGGAAKFVLAWIAAGKPAAFNGHALLVKLNAPSSTGGFLRPNGAFHNATTETANPFSQSLAVLADVAAHHALPAHAVGWLRCAQRSDGGFGEAITDSSSTPPAFCGASSSDTNATAIVLQALSAATTAAADSAAATYLHTQQRSAGGFAFDPSSATDPSSDAAVIQALVAIGQDPTGLIWTKGGGNPLTDLASFADPATGGYAFVKSTAPDAFTTSAIPQALALDPYGAATHIAAGTAPPASPPSTPTPAPSPVPVAVPATGSAGDLGEAWEWGQLLLALGVLALSGAWLRGRRSPAP